MYRDRGAGVPVLPISLRLSGVTLAVQTLPDLSMAMLSGSSMPPPVAGKVVMGAPTGLSSLTL